MEGGVAFFVLDCDRLEAGMQACLLLHVHVHDS